MLRTAALVLVLTFAQPGLFAERVESSTSVAYSAFSPDATRRFDFLVGAWDVDLRTFPDDTTFSAFVHGHASVFSILDRKVVLELWDSKTIQGVGLRLYDPSKKRWELWHDWPNGSPMERLIGGFRHGRGEFLATTAGAKGENVLTIQSFSDITPFSLRWDELYSNDEGKTWTRNLVMEYTRTAVELAWPSEEEAFPTYSAGARCEDERWRDYDILVGTWCGEEATLDIAPVLDGCGLIWLLEVDSGPDEFVFMTHGSVGEGCVAAVVDDGLGTGVVRYTGQGGCVQLSAQREGTFSWLVVRSGGHLGKAGDRLVYERNGRKLELERVGDQNVHGWGGAG